MMSDTIELVERVRRRLVEQDSACTIAGPTPETEIDAAEAALGCTFPPSYRTFLKTFGGITIPPHLGVVHDFAGTGDVVQRTLAARAEKAMFHHLLIVGMGAGSQEWFVLDTSRPTSSGEYPVLLYDARDRALDQQFYDDFGQMLSEVMGFVADNLEQPLD
ncbi:MAG TPA: SMI1/KNR4 family protein [Kofleriaceae bacterium]|jgi:hypothetical protein